MKLQDDVLNSATDWAKMNYEIRTDDEGKQYCVVTGLKNGISKTSIKNATIANKYKGVPVTIIGNNAFMDCSNIKKVVIPNSIISIEWRAFRDCKNLKEITIPDSVTGISTEGFLGCANLEKVTLGNSITKLPSYVFYNCGKLETVIYNGTFCSTEAELKAAGITSIGENAFKGTKIIKE